jgi:homoserine kinase type II
MPPSPQIEAGPPHIGPVLDDHSRRECFEMRELAVVISHYDMGVIDKIQIYPRGSRRSPKLRIKTDRGEFLLKRRGPGRDDPRRVAFAHDLQSYLACQGYPVPWIVPTRGGGKLMVQLNGHIYETFQYVEGTRFDQSVAATEQAGGALGRLHRLLADYKPQSPPPGGTYHAAGELDGRLASVPEAIGQVERQADARRITAICEFLREAYHAAADQVQRAGYSGLAGAILHGDWHPGNLLYQGDAVAAVLDFDSARLGPRIADVANGVLQFSLEMATPEDPATWPDGLDGQRVTAFLRGYDQAAEVPLDRRERAVLAGLMIEALIVESVVPIAATGSFSRIPGSKFLEMVERKVRWMSSRASRLGQFPEV